ILESQSKIHMLDYIMIKKTINYINESSRFDVNFSVNVSSTSIASDDFREKVLSLISVNNDLDNLEFEITETLTRECFDLVQKFILEVREISRIKFSLDDFSTGNSSLLVLDKIHFDTVKIDRSILEILRKNEGGYNHIKEIVNYIKSKESTVCLEGIEDRNDLAIAHELKVTFGQGWLLGKPMTVSDFNLKY
ncbi:EAL domain-containing protein, partial [Vibrio sp. 10N.261.52.A1]